MAEQIALPIGWRHRWESPAPGRERKFLFHHDGKFIEHYEPMMTLQKMGKIPMPEIGEQVEISITIDVIQYIGWRYA